MATSSPSVVLRRQTERGKQLLAEFGRRILLWDSLSVALYLRMPILARSLSSYHLQLRGEVAH